MKKGEERRMYHDKLRTTHFHERVVIRQLQEDGYEVLKRGWPDLLAVHKDRGDVVFVEVKRPREKLKSHQRRVAHILRSLDLCYVVRRPWDREPSVEDLPDTLFK